MAMATDPVCGMEVDTDRAAWTAEHADMTYFFCSKGCMLDFRDEPARYLSPDHRPSMHGHGAPLMPERRGGHEGHSGHH
jgi:Cu+-exporting ATPase